MSPSLAAVLFASQLVVSVADNVPRFDASPSCRAAAALTPASLESCLRDERDAQSKLTREWAQFAVSDRRTCTQTTETGGMPSYVELLTCLEMARDARALPRDKTQ